MTEEMKNQVTSKGIDPALIDRLTGFANQLKEANVTQETRNSELKTHHA